MTDPSIYSTSFQSTLSVRRATFVCTVGGICLIISIHALRKESDDIDDGVVADRVISIHALRKESDHLADGHGPRLVISIHALRKESDRRNGSDSSKDEFQSTLSVRRATRWHA